MRSGSRRCPRSSATAPWSSRRTAIRCRAPTSRSPTSRSRSWCRIAAEFGMTPSSRSRIRVGDKAPEDPFEAFLQRPWLEPHQRRPGHRLCARRWPRAQLLANRLVRLACERHLDDLAQRRLAGPALRSRGGAPCDRLLRLPAPLQGRVGRRRPSRSRPGRRSSSAPCSAGSARMACGASAPPTARCRARTARARSRPASASTCWSPTASRAPRSTPPPPPATRRGSCSTRPSAWSARRPRSSAGSAS